MFTSRLGEMVYFFCRRSKRCGHSPRDAETFQEPGHDNVDSEASGVAASSQPEITCSTSDKLQHKMEDRVTLLIHKSDTDTINITAPIASLSDVDLSDSDDNELDSSLKGHSPSDDLHADEEHRKDVLLGREINDVTFRTHNQLAADDTSKFESARRQSELSSPKHCPSSSEPFGKNGELTSREHENGLPNDNEEDMDIVCELRASSPSMQNKKQLSNLDDFDLPPGETPGLNLDASKQKVQLRQRGSLAKRRKPTRISIRTSSQSDDVFTYTANVSDKPVINGREPSMESSPCSHSDASTPDVEQEQSIHNVDMSAASQRELIQPGKYIHGIKTAIIQSELAVSGRQRLRSVPSPATKEKRSSSVSDDQSSVVPPWMLEAKLRRSSRPSKGDVEKENLNSDPQTPPWLKEALAKKRRSVGRISQRSNDETPIPVNSGQTTPVPWLQEAALRRNHQLEPLSVTQKDYCNNVNNIITDSSHDEVFDDDVPQDVGKTDLMISSSGNDSIMKFNKHFQEQENLPPLSTVVNRSSSETDAYLHKYDKLPAVKHILPPGASLTKKAQPHQMQEKAQEKDEPVWKAEIVMRRKSKSYLIAQKPEQPLKLGEMPQWKKDLLEKNKQRRVSADGSDSAEPVRRRVETSAQNFDLPPWKVELVQRRGSRLSSIGVAPEALETFIEKKKSQVKTPEDEPEWAQLVARRRQRLASSGLLPSEDCTKTE